MEKKESTTSSHVGMCEKLFHAFNPASRPHRRLTLHHQGPGASPNPSPLKEPTPQKALPTPAKPGPLSADQKKPSEAIAPKAEPKRTTTPPPTPSVPVQKVPDKLGLASAPPKAAKMPQPAPPKAAATPQPLPQPAPPQGAAAAAAPTEKPKKNINEKVEDYIKRTKDRLRSVSGIGRTPTIK
ncbi:uncharacterized protein [Elaeis guineensis]|uniref:Alpha carbonic anhydrase 8 n=1 Tax=Elaeis guineensis var. tenera TaxID=51953 RepID=A0A6I9RY65_ELAGV|nr:alpha carbonic anhydrase 8 [Elaeis guineensis]